MPWFHTSEAGFRYAAVLVLTATVLLFTIAAPEGRLTNMIVVLLMGCMLLAVAITSGAPKRTRNFSVALTIFALGIASGLVGSGEVSKGATFVISGVMAMIALPALARGLVRLLRAKGVTVQAVMGALAIYLLIAVVFAYVVGAVAELTNGPYFAQAGKGTQSQRAYFSVTILTTTGLGDLTPVTALGRALTVVEELFGQLYLVTIVSLLVANVGRRPSRGGGADPA
ncbi:MAG TPA: potassium channel family protein [Thermoleophilaceae bacterium]|jgi:hypothetical protein